eukprot:5415644-Alexandrium_andersonii.AAC.1
MCIRDRTWPGTSPTRPRSASPSWHTACAAALRVRRARCPQLAGSEVAGQGGQAPGCARARTCPSPAPCLRRRRRSIFPGVVSGGKPPAGVEQARAGSWRARAAAPAGPSADARKCAALAL